MCSFPLKTCAGSRTRQHPTGGKNQHCTQTGATGNTSGARCNNAFAVRLMHKLTVWIKSHQDCTAADVIIAAPSYYLLQYLLATTTPSFHSPYRSRASPSSPSSQDPRILPITFHDCAGPCKSLQGVAVLSSVERARTRKPKTKTETPLSQLNKENFPTAIMLVWTPTADARQAKAKLLLGFAANADGSAQHKSRSFCKHFG